MLNDGEFFAVAIQSTYHVPADERSRTCPGHGFSAHNVDYTEFRKFSSEAEFRKWIENEEKRLYGKKYEAFICRPVNITKEIKIDVAPAGYSKKQIDDLVEIIKKGNND